MNKREQAKRLLKHYFTLVATESNFRWDYDNESEIEEIVDCIVDAAKEELKEEAENDN